MGQERSDHQPSPYIVETPAKLPANALGLHIGSRVPVCPTPLDSGFRRNDVVLQGSHIVGGDPCAEMQSNYGYDISSSEEEGVPTNPAKSRSPPCSSSQRSCRATIS